jgi:hypothetical protein
VKRTFPRRLRIIAAFVVALGMMPNVAMAAQLNTATLNQSDPRPSQSSNYSFAMSNVTASAIKCIKVVLATTSTGTTVPGSLVSTTAAINTGGTNYIVNTGWTLDATTNGTMLYTNASGATPASSSGRTVELDTITNGNTAGTTYYAQFSTYNNVNCSSSPVDNVVIAYQYNAGQAVSITIDPTLTFAVAGVASSGTVNSATTNVTTTSTTIPLGTPTTLQNQIAAQDLSVSTNAGGGYTVYIRYTAAPTSGSNVLADHTGTNSAPTTFSAAGTEAFGYTTADTTLGTGTAGRFSGNKWAGFTTSNAEVAYDAAPVTSQTTRVGFQVGIGITTKAGNYISTVIYTCTPVF